MRVIHLAYVLLDGLLYMLLRSIVACDCWFYLIPWFWLNWVHLTLSWENVFVLSPRTFCTFVQDTTLVMKSIGSLGDWPPSNTSSYTSWTLDNGQMSSHLTDMVMMVGKWEESPHLWTMYPIPYSTFDGGHCTWLRLDTTQRGDAWSFHLDAGLLMMMSCARVCWWCWGLLAIRTLFDGFEMWHGTWWGSSTFFEPLMMTRGLGRLSSPFESLMSPHMLPYCGVLACIGTIGGYLRGRPQLYHGLLLFYFIIVDICAWLPNINRGSTHFIKSQLSHVRSPLLAHLSLFFAFLVLCALLEDGYGGCFLFYWWVIVS
jgi:hypothetical protein